MTGNTGSAYYHVNILTLNLIQYSSVLLENSFNIYFRTLRDKNLVTVPASRTQMLHYMNNICRTSCCHHLSSSHCQEALFPYRFICSFWEDDLGPSANARCDDYSRE